MVTKQEEKELQEILAMTPELSDEDVERIRAAYPINFIGHIKRVRKLMKNARPGNFAWRTLENEYGFSGDYSAADEGEPPQGAHW